MKMRRRKVLKILFHAESSADLKKGQLDRETVHKSHFGGYSDDDAEKSDEVCSAHSRVHSRLSLSIQPARKKSKAEVMAEVITKSKEHKVMHSKRALSFLNVCSV